MAHDKTNVHAIEINDSGTPVAVIFDGIADSMFLKRSGSVIVGASVIAEIEGEATLQFQQPTVISTKSGAGVLTLESVGNSVIIQAGTDIRLKDDVLLFDNKKLWIGTSKDYWSEYSTSGSRFLFKSRDIDGVPTEGVIFRVLDGTQDVDFLGGINISSNIDTPKISYSSGDLKIQPDVQGDVLLFKDGLIGDGVSGGNLYVYRKATEGTDYLKFFISASQKSTINSTTNLLIQAETGKYIQIIGDNIFLDLQDDLGVQQVKIRDSNNINVSTIDSDGNVYFAGNINVDGLVDGRDVAVDGTKLDGIATEFFISAGEAILSSNASYPTPNDTYHLALADAVTFARCFFIIRIPTGFSGMASGYPKVVFKQGTGGTGNYRIAFNSRAGGIGEQLGSVLDSIAEYTMAAPGTSNELWEEDIAACFDGLSLASGDYVGLQIQRDSDDSLDTFVGDLDVVGIVVKYN